MLHVACRMCCMCCMCCMLVCMYVRDHQCDHQRWTQHCGEQHITQQQQHITHTPHARTDEAHSYPSGHMQMASHTSHPMILLSISAMCGVCRVVCVSLFMRCIRTTLIMMYVSSWHVVSCHIPSHVISSSSHAMSNAVMGCDAM